MCCLATFKMGDGVEDQQVGCLWSGSHLVSVSLSGFINFLNLDDPSKSRMTVKGHNKPITAMVLSTNKKTIYTGASDGSIISWDSETGRNERIEGAGHGVQVNGMVTGSGTNIFTIGFDDTLRSLDTVSGQYTGAAVSLSAQPRAIDYSSGHCLPRHTQQYRGHEGRQCRERDECGVRTNLL